MGPNQRRSWILVLGFGGFGGLLSALYEGFISAGQEPSFGGALYLPVHASFGLAAAIISVFWLVHVDLADTRRTAALALLAGLGWKVVLAGVPTMLTHEASRFHTNAATTDLKRAAATLDKTTEEGSEDDALAAADDIASAIGHIRLIEDTSGL